MSEISERPEQAESQREKSIEREVVLQEFQELRQTITTLETDWDTLIAKLNAEIQEKDAKIADLKEKIENIEREHQQEIQHLEEQRDRQVKDIRDQTDRLQQTIAPLNTDRQVLDQKVSELTRQLQESRDQIEVLTQQVADGERKLEEINQVHEPLIQELKEQIRAKAKRIAGLKEEILNLRHEYQRNTLAFKEDEITKGPIKEGRNQVTKKSLEDLSSARRFLLKVTCPHCKERIAGKFKVEQKSGERASDQDEKKIQKL